MPEIQFSDNHQDLSTDAGFQFEFYCEHCHDAWRSPFDRNAVGTLEGALGAADSLFGGIFGQARNALGQVRGASWSKGRDTAFRAAVEQAKEHFHRCPRCSNHVCEKCWNDEDEGGVCIGCVPRLDPELASIRREAKLARARETAYSEATVSAEDMEQRAVACKDCGAPVGRGKFCPECGAPTSQTRNCSGCSAEVPAGAKFCPECGAKA